MKYVKHFKLFCYIFSGFHRDNMCDTGECSCHSQWQFGPSPSWFWSWKSLPSRSGKCCKVTWACTPCRNAESDPEMSRCVSSQNRRPIRKRKPACPHPQTAGPAWCRERTGLRWPAAPRLRPLRPCVLIPAPQSWNTSNTGSWCDHAWRAAHLRPMRSACHPQNWQPPRAYCNTCTACANWSATWFSLKTWVQWPILNIRAWLNEWIVVYF